MFCSNVNTPYRWVVAYLDAKKHKICKRIQFKFHCSSLYAALTWMETTARTEMMTRQTMHPCSQNRQHQVLISAGLIGKCTACHLDLTRELGRSCGRPVSTRLDPGCLRTDVLWCVPTEWALERGHVYQWLERFRGAGDIDLED
ncbi:hypothetical protein SKAU_G00177640 [Synaphobranchus kaupii]|uniref:Uncharacterized protein n=1 Tax=Synaphobranchus kaupii TaxID=118154 RepID=A0A9Q1FM99_SYNKA|nr:hypothetical protein SKAU_G00177640 [Synaphobranchus kaupii]